MKTIKRIAIALKYWTWQPWRWANWEKDQSILLNWATAWKIAGIICEVNL